MRSSNDISTQSFGDVHTLVSALPIMTNIIDIEVVVVDQMPEIFTNPNPNIPLPLLFEIGVVNLVVN